MCFIMNDGCCPQQEERKCGNCGIQKIIREDGLCSDCFYMRLVVVRRKAKTDEEKKLVRRCYEAGMRNVWASGEADFDVGNFIVEEDCLNLNSICFIDDLQNLEAFFSQGNWMIGQGVIHGSLFFLQQVDGGDEWALHKITEAEVFSFESWSCGRMIESGGFEEELGRVLKASDEQLRRLEY